MDVKYLEKTRRSREVYVYLDRHHIFNNKLHLKECYKGNYIEKFCFMSVDYFVEKIYNFSSSTSVYNFNEWLKHRHFYRMNPTYYFKTIIKEK